ncbi:gliding motility-associated C-terminal domain-containing protein [Formosa haliotis]|uniref:gliding motility-associated C-terminal domain-containing protein n=1 Tax=Formosa haliotis TaxID=1555194 RepID=UPI0008251B7A|nr:gliding motility-associated C-terminal domain-containing protein [Formosa haliotis]
MKKFYAKKIKAYKNIKQYSLLALVLMAFSFYSHGQSAVPFSSRANFTVQGDFTIIGNTNLAPDTPGQSNDSGDMFYVDVDNDITTINSSTADINLLDESGQVTNNSEIVYAGLYWTGRPGPDKSFVVQTDNGPKTLNKGIVSLKGPNSAYTTITAADNDIYYPESIYDNMYIAFADVTDFVKNNGTGSYTVADIALVEGKDNTSNLGIGYYGGWSMIIVYQNTAMKVRNIGVFDGYSFKNVPGDAGYVPSRYINLDISNLNTADVVRGQIGIMAGEGDLDLDGDALTTQFGGTGNYLNRLQHGPNTSLNFFNSTITVDGTERFPSGTIYGLDLHKFDLPFGDSLRPDTVAPNQDQLSLQYTATKDKYVIYNITLSFEDDTLPVPPIDATYECLTDVPAGEPLTAPDNCSPGNTMTSLPQDTINSADPCNIIITRTWSFKDSCDYIFEVSQTINVVDTTAPVAPEAPADTAVSCLTDLPAPLTLQALDNCAGTISATSVDTVVPSDSCNQSVIRTWTFADACGNTTEISQNIMVVDDVLPIFFDDPQDIVYECDGEQRNPTIDAWVELNGYALAEDNCSDITWTNNYNGEALTCNQSVTVEFTATDACGNSVTKSATYTLIDVNAPTIDTAPTDLVLECNENSQSTLNTWLTSNGGAIATDVCSEQVTWTNDFDPDSFTLEACGVNNATTVTFSTSDDCGNIATATATITVIDETAPTVPTNVPADVTVECYEDIPANINLTATDYCAGEITVPGVDTEDNSDPANIIITRTWTFADACGNTSEVSQIITVNDQTAPVLDGPAPTDLTVQCITDVPAMQTLTATDNCSGTITSNGTETTNDTDACNIIITRNWIFSDQSGNTTDVSQTITVKDETAPVVDTTPADLTLDCNEDVPVMEPLTATDNCTGTITSQGTETVDDSNPLNTIITRTWIFADDCGNTTEATQTITVDKDTTAPVVDNAPADLTVECVDDVPPMEPLTATDDCSGTITSNGTETINDTDACNVIITRTWLFTDNSGNSTEVSQTITVADTQAPIVPTIPADVTIDCSDELPAMIDLTAQDNCGAMVTATPVDVTDNSDACNVIITRTWTFEDACGNVSVGTQTINVIDETAPILIEEATDIVFTCDGEQRNPTIDAWVELNGYALAYDSCSDVTWTNNYDSTADICNGAVEVIFTATDACGNSVNTAATYTIIDELAPEITTAAQDITVECGDSNITEIQTWLNTNGGAMGQDVCSDVTWSNDFDPSSLVNASDVTVTFTASDACGNVSTTSATIILTDNIAPIIETPAQDLVVECNENPTDVINAWLANNGGATATDNCSDLTWTNNFTTGATSVTFTATDANGNFVTTTATITYTDDTAPIIDTPAQNLVVECNEDPTDVINAWLTNNGGATATDFCSDITWTNNFTPGATSVTFTATDANGNFVTTTATITYTDTMAPVIDTPAQNLVVECNEDPTDVINAWLANNGGATATDFCSDITWTNNFTFGATSVTFTATDANGNFVTTTATITYTDQTAPVIDTPAQNLVIECNEDPTDIINAWLANNGGATATDFCSDITWTNNFTTGATSVTFTATDANGNFVTTTATITYTDTMAPVIDTPAQNLVVECNEDPTDVINAWLANNGGATATDFCSDITWTNNFTTGATSVTFTATDANGNFVTTTATITYTDTMAPVIDTPAQNLVVECNEDPTDAINAWLANNGGATATDFCSDITWTNNFTFSATSVTFTATDANGNFVTTTATITYTDQTAPVIDTPAQNLVIECNEDPTDIINAWLANNGGATAIDFCSDITWTNNYTDGATTVTFTVTDAAGNFVTTTATITYTDETAPVVDNAPADTTYACIDDVPALDTLTATDACDGTITDAGTETIDNADACNVIITRTWMFTDSSGNSTTTTQVITVIDDVAPTAPTVPADVTVECGDDVPAMIDLTATDNCGASITATGVDTTNDIDATSSIITRTWTFTDACGNTTEVSQIITVADTTPPTLVSDLDTEVLVNCTDVPAKPDLVFADNCSTDLTVDYTEENTSSGAANENYLIIREWTVSDSSGNTSVFTQTITVNVHQEPVLVSDSACTEGGPIDLNSYLADNTSSGTWVVDSGDATLNGSIFDPIDSEVGTYVFTFTEDSGCQNQTTVTLDINEDCVPPTCDPIISTSITPNGDQWNEFFTVTGIDRCGFVIEVEIYNRWGALVYKSLNYQNNWSGQNDSSAFGNSNHLPTGTYYYIVTLKNSGLKPLTGPIYLGTK